MKRTLIALCALLALVSAGIPGMAAGTDKVLYSFDKGTDGWWTFANGATLKLSNDATTGAGGSASSLLASYQWQPGGGSYMGIGIQPKWSMAGDAWSNYNKGHITFNLKSDVAITARIELRASDKKTYTFHVTDVPSAWKTYAIGFDKFVNDGKGIDLSAVDIDQIVVVPQKVNDDAHSFWMDNISISKDPATP